MSDTESGFGLTFRAVIEIAARREWTDILFPFPVSAVHFIFVDYWYFLDLNLDCSVLSEGTALSVTVEYIDFWLAQSQL